MTTSDLNEIEDRVAGTPLHPWSWHTNGVDCAPHDGSFQKVGNILVLEGQQNEIVLSLDKDVMPCDDAIADFLVHCRSDIVSLIHEVRRLKSLIGE